MLEKIEGLMLRAYPYSETSEVVAWLTPSHGRILSLVKGAKRPKSAFLGQYDLFYTCEIVLSRREGAELFTAREFTPIATRSRLRSDWRSCACASAVAATLSRCAPTGHADPELYALATRTMDTLAGPGGGLALLHWFELRLATHFGVPPRLEQCARCGQPLGDAGCRRAVPDGGIICPTCAPTGGASAPVAAGELSLLRRLQRMQGPAPTGPLRYEANQGLAIHDFLGSFCGYHLGVPPEYRNVAWQILRRNPAGANGRAGKGE